MGGRAGGRERVGRGRGEKKMRRRERPMGRGGSEELVINFLNYKTR